MDEQRNGSLRIWTPLLFALVLIAGMLIGFKLRDTLRNKRTIETVIERNDRLEQIIDLINEKYVDTINSNTLYQDAVSGILSHLDPHTVYIPADELQGINESLEGSFFGIGVEFAILRDTIQVTSVIPNGPAEQAGVQVGDQFIKVGDSVVAGKNITADRIIKLLKGKQYSLVPVLVKQPFQDAVRRVAIKRDVVPIYSVEADLMLDDVTGYIKINRFSATTYDEFSASLKKLIANGMEDLIVDLRDNPGGYLDAATQIADEFISGRKLLVYTQGKRPLRTRYTAGEKGDFEKGRIIILVNENSASASEILAGAVQDWDRGVIVGRRTFGKGLVQEQYDLEDGAALRLTIAKYYTPSGRCIQRSFAKGKAAYGEDFQKRFESGEFTGYDTLTTGDTTPYYTANNRVVYGGGGIKPDVYVPYDTMRLSVGLLNMIYSDELKNILWDHFLKNRGTLKFASVKEFEQQFNSEQELAKMYLASLKDEDRKAASKLLALPANNKFFLLQIKAQFARYLFRNNGYYAIATNEDHMVQMAFRVLQHTYSKIIGR